MSRTRHGAAAGAVAPPEFVAVDAVVGARRTGRRDVGQEVGRRRTPAEEMRGRVAVPLLVPSLRQSSHAVAGVVGVEVERAVDVHDLLGPTRKRRRG